MSCAKTAQPIQMLFCGETRVGTQTCIKLGPDPTHEKRGICEGSENPFHGKGHY